MEVPASVPPASEHPTEPALPPAEAPAPSLVERARAAWATLEAWLLKLPTAERWAVAAITAGVILRLAAPFTMDFRADGNTYTAMGHALATRGSLLMPWGDVTTWAREAAAPSHHYPPLYPAVLAVAYKLLGWHLWVSKGVAVALSLAVLPLVWWCTKDLFDRESAWLTTGVVAAMPHLVWVTGTGFSENLVMIFFALTMWGILKSLANPRYIVVAGLAAGCAYLTRASVGYFFVIAGLGGFLWRFAYVRWRVFTNGSYLAAIAVFGSIVTAWATRNVLNFGWSTETWFGYSIRVPNWQTSSYTQWVSNYAFARPWEWAESIVGRAPLFLGFLAWMIAPFLPETWRSLRRIREESVSALWLSVFLVLVIAWVMAAMFFVYEKAVFFWEHQRYVVIAAIPIAWAVFPRAKKDGGAFRARYAMLLVTLVVSSAFLHVKPTQFADIRAAEALDPLLQPGDEVAVDGWTIKYAFYAYLSDPQAITIYGWQDGTTEKPDYILTLKYWQAYPGYREVGEYRTTYWNGDVMRAKIFERV